MIGRCLVPHSLRAYAHFTFAICRRPSVCLSVVCLSVCLSSVTFVHPTQAIEIFGNVSTPFGTLAICDLAINILRRSSQGNPSGEGLNQREAAKYTDFGPFQGYSRKRCKIGAKLVVITNRKSHMGFRLVPKSVTMNDLERRNRLLYFTEFGSFLGGLRKSG